MEYQDHTVMLHWLGFIHKAKEDAESLFVDGGSRDS